MIAARHARTARSRSHPPEFCRPHRRRHHHSACRWASRCAGRWAAIPRSWSGHTVLAGAPARQIPAAGHHRRPAADPSGHVRQPGFRRGPAARRANTTISTCVTTRGLPAPARPAPLRRRGVRARRGRRRRRASCWAGWGWSRWAELSMRWPSMRALQAAANGDQAGAAGRRDRGRRRQHLCVGSPVHGRHPAHGAGGAAQQAARRAAACGHPRGAGAGAWPRAAAP